VRKVKNKTFLLVIISILFSTETFASHAAGMDITYKYVGTLANPGGITGIGREVSVTVITDYYGTQASWAIRDGAGNIYAQGGPYTNGCNLTSSRTHVVTVCLPTNTSLKFHWYDSDGDGWNSYCTNNMGYYVTQGTATLTSGTPTNGSSGLSTFSVNNSVTPICTWTTLAIIETLEYEITLAFYRECNAGGSPGLAAPNSIDIRYKKMSGGSQSSWISLPRLPGSTNITPVCSTLPGDPCTSGLISNAYVKYTYKKIITLPSRDSWKIWNDPIYARNATTYGSIGGGNWDDLCVIANIDNTTYLSSSPVFSSDPVGFLCAGSGGDCFYNGATDPDLDNLSYSLIQPKTDQGVNDNMLYQGGATYLQPYPSTFTSPSTTTCDPITGDLCINTSLQGTSVAAIRVTESRNGNNVGFVTRDIQVWSRACSNTSSTSTSTNINSGTITGFNDTTKTFNFCANGSSQLSFTTDVYSNSNLEINYSGLPIGATFTTNPSIPLTSDTVMGTFNWIPTPADILGSPYILNIVINDDNCPIPNSTTLTYIINLKTGLSDSITNTITDVSCNGQSNGNISLSISGNQGPYSFVWSTGDSSQNISNIGGGIYNVIVTDSLGCYSNQSYTLIDPPVFTASVNKNNITCFNSNDGMASINTFGVTATYIWSNLAFSDSIYNLSAGIYSVDITSPDGCILTEFITITEPNAISTTTITSNISCNGLNDGNITLTINGGIPDYTIDAPPYNQTLIGGINTFTTPSLLSSGIYNYSITDSNGCVFNSSVILSEPAPISVTESQTNVNCNGGNDGTATIIINGGTPNYIQNWGPNNPLNLSEGAANYQITDNNGCTYTDSVIITEPNILTATFTQTNVSTCLGADGSINTTISGGTNPYIYSWNNGFITEDLNNLSAGIYLLTVTDDKGCIAILNVTITEPLSPTLSFSQANVSCYDGNDGSIDLTVNGGTSPFTYIWTTTATTQDINSLIEGQYTVQVSDNNSCTQNITITITEPTAPNISTTHINIDCNGNTTGSIDLTIVGPSTPYNTTWNNGFITEDLNNLSAGIYSYTITDINGCNYSDIVNVTEPYSLNISPNVSNVSCKGWNNGYIILNTSGGTASYNESFGTANPASLTAGNYPFTIIDNNGCVYSSSISITEPDSLLVTSSSTNATCEGYFDGTALLIKTGGVPGYTDNWGISNPNGLNAGIHTYTVNDANNCTAQGNITITEPPGMQITIDTFSVSCFGLNDGYATLTISGGGGAPYIQDWGTVNPNTLLADTHLFSVTDANNCTAQGHAVITQPNDIQINEIISDVTCFGENDGTALLQINGGIAPYTENWNGIDITTLSAGSYTYSVIDINNCVKNSFITINEPDTLRASATIVNSNCFNSNDGKIYLNITGGTSPYSKDFGIYNSFALEAGNYNFIVTDVNGCRFDSNTVVGQADELLINFSAESPICRNDSSEITISINNPLNNIYTIIIQDSIQQSFVIDSSGILVPEGVKLKLSPNFTNDLILLSITDENGCSSSSNDIVNVIVNQLPALDITLTDICVGSPSFTINGGIPTGGNYFINDKNTNFFDVENLENGAYTIQYRYTDIITSCSNVIEKIINIYPSPTAKFSFSPQPANIDNPNILFINESNNIENTKWNLGDGTILEAELEFLHTYTDTGTYEIIYVVNNIFNCIDSATAIITINPVYKTFIPSAFTPDNDGDNDYFYPSIIGGNSYNMKIYNRWGEIIYNEDNGTWDGKLNNNAVKDGLYCYSISVNDFKNKPFIYTGIVTLIK